MVYNMTGNKIYHFANAVFKGRVTNFHFISLLQNEQGISWILYTVMSVERLGYNPLGGGKCYICGQLYSFCMDIHTVVDKKVPVSISFCSI